MRVAVITTDTKVYRHIEDDASGDMIRSVIEAADDLELVFSKALPNDLDVITTVLARMADGEMADLILTTGGSGMAPNDCTPEATLGIVERQVAGIPEALRIYMLPKTKRAMLNRGAAGVRNKTLIVNLPGKPKAARVALNYLLPVIIHAVEVLQED